MGDPIEGIKSDGRSVAAPLEDAHRLDCTEMELELWRKVLAGVAERQARPSEQSLGRFRLEDPANPLVRLNHRDRRIAVIGHKRSQRVALGQDEGGAPGPRPRVEFARKAAKSLDPRGGVERAERDE